jgi:hypothetical protein
LRNYDTRDFRARRYASLPSAPASTSFPGGTKTPIFTPRIKIRNFKIIIKIFNLYIDKINFMVYKIYSHAALSREHSTPFPAMLLWEIQMLKLFEQCPACGGPLVITEIQCSNCHLKMQGEFKPGLFSTLSDDQLTFVRAFLRVRGNLSEMEKVLGVSYPTIRNKLDEINQTLDQAEKAPNPVPANDNPRTAILNKLAAGEIDATEALAQLKGLA